MVDEEVISLRLQNLEKVLRELDQIAAEGKEAFLGSWKNMRLAERCLEVAAQTCLDIGNHLIAAKGFRVPKGYADVFQVLAESGMLDSDLAAKMKSVAGLRNILVHDYLEIDHGQLHKMIQDTGVFRKFANSVKKEVWD